MTEEWSRDGWEVNSHLPEGGRAGRKLGRWTGATPLPPAGNVSVEAGGAGGTLAPFCLLVLLQAYCFLVALIRACVFKEVGWAGGASEREATRVPAPSAWCRWRGESLEFLPTGWAPASPTA